MTLGVVKPLNTAFLATTILISSVSIGLTGVFAQRSGAPQASGSKVKKTNYSRSTAAENRKTLLAPPFKRRADLVLDADNPNQPLVTDGKENLSIHPASITKMMFLAALLKKAEKEKIDLNKPFTLETKHFAEKESTHVGLKPKQVVSGMQLIDYAGNASDNLATNVLAIEYFGSEAAAVKAMNDLARELGMTGSLFYNVEGMPGNIGACKQKDMYGYNVTTTKDLALLLLHYYKDYPEFLPHLSRLSVIAPNGKEVKSTNQRLINDERVEVMGGKTGFICLAGRNVALITKVRLENGQDKYLLIVSVGHGDLNSRAFTVVELQEKAITELKRRESTITADDILGKERKSATIVIETAPPKTMKMAAGETQYLHVPTIQNH